MGYFCKYLSIVLSWKRQLYLYTEGPTGLDSSMPIVARALMRLLTVSFLLLLGSGEDGRANIRKRTQGSTTEAFAPANRGAILAAAPVRLGIDAVTLHLSAPDTNQHDAPIQSAPAPTLPHRSFCSCERARGEAARPPPLQA